MKHYLSKGETLLQEEKLYIMTTKKLSGVYTITNKVNGKIYIGESLDIYRRWHKEHIPQLRKDCHYNKELQKEFNKYGEENFRFEVLERYSEGNPITTKARILILESYYMDSFKKSGICLYNAENTLAEILKGNKNPETGKVLIYTIIHTMAEFDIKECDGVIYFNKKSTLKNILLDYVIPNIAKSKGETIPLLLKEFEGYIGDNGYMKKDYINRHTLRYILDGKKSETVIEEIYEDKVKDIERLAILFSEHKKQMRKREKKKKEVTTPMYEDIKDGEIRFSLLFKDFAKEGILPNNYAYQKVREYLVKLDIIYLKKFNANNVTKNVTYATDNALDKDILRIVGCKNQGDEVIYNYVFTKNGVECMRKTFLELDEEVKIKLFAQDDVALSYIRP